MYSKQCLSNDYTISGTTLDLWTKSIINFYFRLDEDGKVLTPEEILYRVCYKKAKHV